MYSPKIPASHGWKLLGVGQLLGRCLLTHIEDVTKMPRDQIPISAQQMEWAEEHHQDSGRNWNCWRTHRDPPLEVGWVRAPKRFCPNWESCHTQLHPLSDIFAPYRGRDTPLDTEIIGNPKRSFLVCTAKIVDSRCHVGKIQELCIGNQMRVWPPPFLAELEQWEPQEQWEQLGQSGQYLEHYPMTHHKVVQDKANCTRSQTRQTPFLLDTRTCRPGSFRSPRGPHTDRIGCSPRGIEKIRPDYIGVVDRTQEETRVGLLTMGRLPKWRDSWLVQFWCADNGYFIDLWISTNGDAFMVKRAFLKKKNVIYLNFFPPPSCCFIIDNAGLNWGLTKRSQAWVRLS